MNELRTFRQQDKVPSHLSKINITFKRVLLWGLKDFQYSAESQRSQQFLRASTDNNCWGLFEVL